MSLQRDGCQFPLSFHLVNDKGDQGKVKPSRGRVKVKSQFNSILKGNIKLELIQVDRYGASFGVLRRVAPVPPNLIEKTEDFIRTGDSQKKI